MSFPCLAHISLHLHEHQLHMQAVYRNEFLIGRAYGNYLGLAQLQAYIATAAGVGVGELLITAGHVELDGHRQAVGAMLARLSAVQAS
jgi:thymidylate synthase